MHEFPKTNHATFLYPTACLPLPFSMQWWGVHAVVVITCRWRVAKKKLGTYMQRTPPPMYKKQKKHKKETKKKEKNKEVPGFDLTNFEPVSYTHLTLPTICSV